MFVLKRLAASLGMQVLVRASPWIVLGVLLAALVVERTTIIRVTGERDRIIHVIDPTGKTSPDQAIIATQLVLTQRDAANHALTVTVRNYRLATVKAQVADLNHARAVERRDADINAKVQHDLNDQLASARADADAHYRSLRTRGASPAAASTNQGGIDAAGLPRPAGAPSGPAGAHPAAELDDSRACATGIVVAEGWQRWWTEIVASRR